MAVLYDARGNEYVGWVDILQGNSIADTRPTTVVLGALNAETVMELQGTTTVVVDARTAAGALTLSFQASVDGTNFIDLPVTNMATQSTIVNPALTGASANNWVAHVGGFQVFRVRVTAYTSGNITVGCRGTMAPLRPSLEQPYPTQLWVTATAAANAAATATLPAPGAGLFIYITHIDITRNATAALAGTATIIHTTTGLPGNPAWSVGNGMAAGGTQIDVNIDFSSPLKSTTANGAVTVVAAAGGAAVLGRVNVGYFVGA
jgi:hypothetical protein